MIWKVVEALAKAEEREQSRVTGDVYALSRRERRSWESNLTRKVLTTKLKTFILYAEGRFLVG